MTTGEGTWRVICEDGKTHTMKVRHLTDTIGPEQPGDYMWHADCDDVGGTAIGRTPREAVQTIVRMAFWTPTEILAPGEKTRAEAVAAAVAEEREACALLADWNDDRFDGYHAADVSDHIAAAIRARGAL